MSDAKLNIPVSTPPPRPVARDSWVWVAFALLALIGAAAAIVAAWWPAMPRPPAGWELYNPLSDGTSHAYRILQRDGTVRFFASNIEELPGNDVVGALHLEGFVLLMKMIGQDIDTLDTDAAIEAIAPMRFVRVVETRYDATGLFTTSHALLLPEEGGFGTMLYEELAFDPPVPSLVDMAVGAEPLVVHGMINRVAPYTATLTVEAREALDTPAGHFDDCLRVRHRLITAWYDGYDLTWYCAGVGVVRQEGWDTANPTHEVFELLSVSAPGRAAATDLPLPTGADQAEPPTRAYPAVSGGGASLAWAYPDDRTGNNFATTLVLPLPDLLLYATQNGGVRALDRKTQTLRWRFQTGSTVYGTLAVADGLVFVASTDRRLYAVDLASGAFRWAFATRDAISAGPAAAEGTVYVGSEDGMLYALDTHTGQERWRFGTGGPIAVPPVLADGLLYVGSDSGALYALDAGSGEVRWAYAADAAIGTAPVVADGVVYVGSYDKMLYALAAQPATSAGALLWQYDAGEDVVRDVTVSGGVLYLALKQQVRALDAATGAERWRYFGDEDLYGAPLLLGDVVVVRRTNDVLALDATVGTRRWATISSESSAFAGLSSDGRHLFVSTADGALQVWALKGGRP